MSILNIKRILCATSNSLKGINGAFKSEAAFRQEIVLSIAVISSMLFLKFSFTEIILISISLFVMLITELINTAIEATIDNLKLPYTKLSALAKDSASAAVFFAVIMLLFVWGGIIIKNYA